MAQFFPKLLITPTGKQKLTPRRETLNVYIFKKDLEPMESKSLEDTIATLSSNIKKQEKNIGVKYTIELLADSSMGAVKVS